MSDFPPRSSQQGQVYECICALLGLWALLTINWMSGFLLSGELLFDSPRLQGMCTLMFFILPGISILFALLFGSLRVRVLAGTALPMLGFVAMASCFAILEACDEVSTNQNPMMEVIDKQRVDSATCIYVYLFNPGALGSCRKIMRTETTLLPGLLWVHTLERSSGYSR